MTNDENDTTTSLKRSSDGRCFSQFEVQTVKSSLTWTIKNFSFCFKKNGDSLKSAVFSDKPDSKLEWYLRVYPKGLNVQVLDFLSVFLYLNSSDVKPVFAKFELLLLNSNKKFFKKVALEYLFESDKTGFGWDEFLERNLLFREENGLLPDDELTIHCEVIASFDSDYVSNPERPFVVHKKELPLAKNLVSLLKSEKFSDVTLIIQDKKFRAHKAILAANSAVFSAMFEHDMKEKDNNLVDIKDLDSEAVEIMLRFLYTAETPVLDLKKAKDVLAASDKYSIDSLKSICEEYLASTQTVETAADVLYLADLHNAADLKRCCLNFIRNQAAEVLKTPSWKLLTDRRPNLLLEAFENVVLN